MSQRDRGKANAARAQSPEQRPTAGKLGELERARFGVRALWDVAKHLIIFFFLRLIINYNVLWSDLCSEITLASMKNGPWCRKRE